MESPFFSQFKKNATSFMHERYKDAKLFLTAITEAEMLAEKITNNEPCSPDARAMASIAEAAYYVDDYWRIVDVLRRRLHRVDWKLWRQSYKSLVLLDFLLAHGPEELSTEFDEDIDVIEELGSFKYTDENGIDWGLNMQKKSERVLELLKGTEALVQARVDALKITEEIQGFESISISSSSSLSPSASSSGSYFCILDSATSSSSGGASTPAWSETDAETDEDELYPWVEEDIGRDSCSTPSESRDIPWRSNADRTVFWDSSSFFQETDSLTEIDEEDELEEEEEKGKFSSSFIGGLCSKLGISPRGNGKFGFMNVSGDAEMRKERIYRQLSVG